MFEVIGAIAYSALYAAVVGVLGGFSPARRSTKLAVAAAAALSLDHIARPAQPNPLHPQHGAHHHG